jgi:hypothetical protein
MSLLGAAWLQLFGPLRVYLPLFEITIMVGKHDYLERAERYERQAALTKNKYSQWVLLGLAEDYRALARFRQSPSIVPKSPADTRKRPATR